MTFKIEIMYSSQSFDKCSAFWDLYFQQCFGSHRKLGEGKQTAPEKQAHGTCVRRADRRGRDSPQNPISAKDPTLKAAQNRSGTQQQARLSFCCCWERVETMRCFWEMKHIEMEGDCQQLRDRRGRDGTVRPNLRGLRLQRKKKPPDTPEIAALRKEVHRINQLNAERLGHLQPVQVQPRDELLQEADKVLDSILNAPRSPGAEQEKIGFNKEENETLKGEEELVKLDVLIQSGEDSAKTEDKAELVQVQEAQLEGQVEEKEEKEEEEEQANRSTAEAQALSDSDQRPAECARPPGKAPMQVVSLILDSCEERAQSSVEVVSAAGQLSDITSCSKRHVTEDLEKKEHKKSRVEDGLEEDHNSEVQVPPETEQMEGKEEEEPVEDNVGTDVDDDLLEFFIDCNPPPPAPFNHRLVSAKPNQISSFYTINYQEILGGGRFGQVHKCIENSSGLTFAAKIIKAKHPKEKELVKNEIQVMNQLDHANLIQLYAAYESRNDTILVLEYVDGGELFDRIIDENYKLTELDSVMFIRQICEGIQHMHKMYILHLDLKPENIMCVSRVTNKIKIIDFGLARKYQPREKLKVNFGTPEFLAPEVINYDYVSFSTDMWSLGVITYMLLSSLSPFLGDDDSETLNNILACQWSFEEDEFTDISDAAKDFISKLMVFNKSWRISALEALKHPWLSDPSLHHHLHEKKNRCRSRRSSCVPPCEM